MKKKPKKTSGKDNSADKKSENKGNKEAKWLTRKLKRIYLWKTKKLKTRRAQPQTKQESKKPSLISIINHIVSGVPGSFLYNSEEYFLSTTL